MKIYRFFLILATMSLSAAVVLGQRLADHYDWHQANTGGGGYITGVVQDVQNPNVLYARCDVGGVFKTVDKGRHWQTCNSGLTEWYNHSVQSIAIDPQNSDVVFRCSGDKRNQVVHGSIHKSSDGGETWRKVLDKVGFWGNGETRMYGEVIAVDPFDGNRVIAGGYANGLWTSNDGGESWQFRLGADEIFLTVAIHPYFQSIYYAATQSGKLYQSTDGGDQWQQIFHDAGLFFTEMAFDTKNSSLLYCSGKGGMYRSADGGKSFTRMKGLPDHFQYNTIVSNPNNSRHLLTAPDARPNHPFSPLPVFVSMDGGKTWKKIPGHNGSQISEYPTYIKNATMVGWAISKVRFDVSSKNRFFFSNWYGVSFTEDGGNSFTGKDFSGLETNCLENIVVDPASPQTTYYTLPDHMPMVSRDGGRHYYSLPRTASYSSSTALVPSVHDTSLVLFGARDRHKNSGAIVRVKQGETSVLFSFEEGFLQNIKEDPFQSGAFYCSIDGDLSTVGGIYKSTDWGQSWSKLPLQLPSYVNTLPHAQAFIENELLNIVVGQKKNVCGTNKLLAMDVHQQDVLYFGEWTEGVFRSKDGGRTWENVGDALPFHRDTASVLNVLKVDPTTPGRLYAGFIREGLWRSDDSSDSWRKIYPLEDTICNISAIYISRKNPFELLIAGETLYWSDAPAGIWQSKDGGTHFKNIYDRSKGALRIKALDVDEESGIIVVATSGNGAFYLTPK